MLDLHLPWYSPFEEVEVGDIIVFNRPSGHDRVIVHRVVSIIDNDPFTIRTKGDANPASIPGTDFPITDEEFIGKVANVIPQVGAITQILRPPVNYVIIAIIIGIMVFKQISKSKKEKEIDFDDSVNSENDKTDFWVCPNCNGNIQMKDGREYCQSCKIYLSQNKVFPKDDAYTNSQAEGNKNINDKENKVESKSEKNNNSKDFTEKKD